MDVRYPDVSVKLIGENGNAFAILNSVTKALKRAGVSVEEIAQFKSEAMSGDYNNLLRVCMDWVEVD